VAPLHPPAGRPAAGSVAHCSLCGRRAVSRHSDGWCSDNIVTSMTGTWLGLGPTAVTSRHRAARRMMERANAAPPQVTENIGLISPDLLELCHLLPHCHFACHSPPLRRPADLCVVVATLNGWTFCYSVIFCWQRIAHYRTSVFRAQNITVVIGAIGYGR